jgi:hypothetical protein
MSFTACMSVVPYEILRARLKIQPVASYKVLGSILLAHLFRFLLLIHGPLVSLTKFFWFLCLSRL